MNCGSYRRRENGSWQLRVHCGTDYKGKPIIKSKTVRCSSEAQAKKELAKFYALCQQSEVGQADKITLSAFCDLWLKDCSVRLKPSTVNGYKKVVNFYIKGGIGENRLANIKAMNVQQWVNEIASSDVSGKTIKNVFSILRNIFSKAVKWEYIPSNPCTKVELPKVNKHEAESYSIEEVKLLLSALKTLDFSEERNKTITLVALTLGLRKSEIFGLDWPAIDFDTNTVSIYKTRMVIPGEGVIESTPKTETSNRQIGMPESLAEELKLWKAKQDEEKKLLGSQWKETAAVFTGDFGGPLYPQNYVRWFGRFLEANNLRKISLHKLRHTQASMLVDAGVPISMISKRLGHANTNITLSTYTHLYRENDKIATDVIENVLK